MQNQDLCTLEIDKNDLLLVPSIGSRRKALKTFSIMIIEDDPIFISILSKIVGRYTVYTADNAKEGIRSYIHRVPNLIFLDIGLPDTNGLYLLDKLMEIDPDAYVVIVSGESEEKKIKQASKSGIKGFVGKPFEPVIIQKHVAKCFAMHEKST